MKRNFELVRQLLLFFEDKDDPSHVECPPIEGFDDLTIKYHLVLIYDAGLLSCEAIKSSTSDRVIYVLPFELTWEGHEFLEKIRADSTWSWIKKCVKENGSAFSFSVVNALGTKYAISSVEDLLK